MRLLTGDCLAIMPTLDAESIDAIVTDPPYGINPAEESAEGGILREMGLPTDYDYICDECGNDLATEGYRLCLDCLEALPPPEKHGGKGMLGHISANWSEKGTHSRGYFDNDNPAFQRWCESWAVKALRVAKPGAHLLAFGGTRTYHRLACAIEDAGWEVRDCLVWAYASGWPKGLNLKGEREGWGTTLKPSIELVILARKPLRGTVATNVSEWGTGALNIAGARTDEGRWPSNLVLTDPVLGGDSPVFLIPKASGGDRGAGNSHPTVKPIALMRHLVRLVTPPGGTVVYCPVCEGERERYVPTVRGNGSAQEGAAVLHGAVSGGQPEARADHLRDVRESVPPEGELDRPDSTVLHQDLRGPRGDAPAEALRGVPDAVSAGHSGGAVLFPDMLGSDDRAQPTGDDAEPGGLRHGVEPDAPERDALGLRDAAPPDHGGRDGASAGGRRSSRSHQRGEGRQPTGEPASAGEAGARQPAEAAPEAHRVSALPRDPDHLGSCPVCRGPLAAEFRRSVVLDPFLGSGTTAMACEMEGFDWIGIEREPEYVAIAEARLALVQRGLGLGNAEDERRGV